VRSDIKQNTLSNLTEILAITGELLTFMLLNSLNSFKEKVYVWKRSDSSSLY